MTPPTLRLELADVDALRRELNENLRVGGCFVHGASGLSDSNPCILELVHPDDGAVMQLSARVVWVADEPTRQGIGLTLLDFGPDKRDEIERFIDTHEGAAPAAEAQLGADGEGDLFVEEGAAIADEVKAATPHAAAGGEAASQARHERLRGLSSAEQVKVARRGEASDRVVLERMYGKAVWPALISNQRLTPPEVARLARMGNMPRPQLEQIVANGTWLQNPQVRRSLLSNPRVTQDMALKVLRMMPQHELKLVPSQTIYPQAVRAAARRLLAR